MHILDSKSCHQQTTYMVSKAGCLWTPTVVNGSYVAVTLKTNYTPWLYNYGIGVQSQLPLDTNFEATISQSWCPTNVSFGQILTQPSPGMICFTGSCSISLCKGLASGITPTSWIYCSIQSLKKRHGPNSKRLYLHLFTTCLLDMCLVL